MVRTDFNLMLLSVVLEDDDSNDGFREESRDNSCSSQFSVIRDRNCIVYGKGKQVIFKMVSNT